MNKLLLDDKQVEDKVFDIVEIERISSELGHMFTHLFNVSKLIVKIFGYVHLLPYNLILQEIHFVQEEDNGDFGEGTMVGNGLENGSGFFQAVDPFVLQEFLVKFGGGGQKKNGRDFVKALEPFLSLSPLASHVDEKEWNVRDVHAELMDAFGGFPTIKDVLLGRNIIGDGDAVDMIIKITHAIRQIIFGASFKGFKDAFVSPKITKNFPEVAKVANIDCGKIVKQENLK